MTNTQIQVSTHNKAAYNDKNSTVHLSEILAVNSDWKLNRDSAVAHYGGIKSAKGFALKSTEGLLAWGRFLSWPVIFVSAVHIWESVSRIAPETVSALSLPPQTYHIAALLFTILIDVVAVYILKANTALAYTTTEKNSSIWFFYILTALLNGSFVAANSPDATDALQNGLIEFYGNIFVILLPITVPIALWAIEEANKKLEASKIALTVDIATLDGLIKSNSVSNSHSNNGSNNTHIAVTNNSRSVEPIDKVLETDSYPNGVLPQQTIVNHSEEVVTANNDAYNCLKCGALLPDRGSKRKNQGYRMSTKLHGCPTCNPKKS